MNEYLEKILGTVKDLPVWVLGGLAVASNLLCFVPVLKAQLPKDFHPWVLIAAVATTVLVATRLLGLIARKVQQLAAAKAARRTFHMTPEGRQSWWHLAKQRDGSILTQINAHVLVKNLTDAPIGLVATRLARTMRERA